MSVIAIRIYYDEKATPMADLKFHDGTMITIQWTKTKQRENFKSEITGYTLFYDEREKCSWDDWPGEIRTIEDVLDVKLEDDGNPYGGIAFAGETVRDFLNEHPNSDKIKTLEDLNIELMFCGIKAI